LYFSSFKTKSYEWSSWGSIKLKAREPVKANINPCPTDSKKLVQEGLEKSKVVFIVGSCEVLYRGRASSTLGSGERIVIITEDKALLIHRSQGYRAVNWQPAGCKFRLDQSLERSLEITAVRMKPLESVKISFSSIYLICTFDLVDDSKMHLYASEFEMKKAILYKPSLIEDGFTPITSEKEMSTGFVDIFGRDKEGNYAIIEIKRGRATREAVMQLARYIQLFRKGNPNARGILVAESLAKGAERTIVSLNLEFKRLNPKKCSEILGEIQKNDEKAITDYI
jgi:RecB family endonuclease NucS